MRRLALALLCVSVGLAFSSNDSLPNGRAKAALSEARKGRSVGRVPTRSQVGAQRGEAERSQSGTIRGVVKVSKKGFFGKIGDSDDRSGVLVYVTGYDESAPREAVTLAQQNERFVPRILPIVAGQTVTFPNRDRLYHNVFSVSPSLSFDLGQYKSTDSPRTQLFDKPGLVPVYCNIHPQMISYVVVLENRAFAMTGEDGAFELRNVRAGKLALNAWMPGAQRVTRQVALAPGAEAVVDLEIEQTQTIPPHLRKDGTPYPAQGDYEN